MFGWVGEQSRTFEALQNKLLALGFRSPLRVSVIEALMDSEASSIRGIQQGFTTPNPELYQGLSNALTIAKTTALSYYTPVVSSSKSSSCTMGYPHGHKRANNRLSREMSDVTTSENTAKLLRELSMLLDEKLSRSSSSPSPAVAKPMEEVYLDAANSQKTTNPLNCNTWTVSTPHTDIFTDLHSTPTVNTATFEVTFENVKVRRHPITEVTNKDTRASSMWNAHIVGFECFANPVTLSATIPFNSTTNDFHTTTRVNNISDSVEVTKMTFDRFKHRYINSPLVLDRIITESLSAEIWDNPTKQSLSQSNESRSQIQLDQNSSRQDLHVHSRPDPCQMSQPLEVEHQQTSELTRKRETMPQERELLNCNRRWRSIGFDTTNLVENGYTP